MSKKIEMFFSQLPNRKCRYRTVSPPLRVICVKKTKLGKLSCFSSPLEGERANDCNGSCKS